MTLHSKIYRIPQTNAKNGLNSNIKYELIVVVRAEEMNEMSDALLNNVISAIKLINPKQTIIIKSQANTPFQYNNISGLYSNAKCMVFGISPEEIGLHIKVTTNRIQRFGEHQLLFTSSIKQIMEEQELGKKQSKIQLWKAIQILFDL